MKYLIHTEAKGYGCDYTIGCNHSVRIYDAESMEDMVEKVTKGLLAGDWIYSAGETEELCIYEISQKVELDLGKVTRDRAEIVRQEEQAVQEQFERKVLEQLKEKYEGRMV